MKACRDCRHAARLAEDFFECHRHPPASGPMGPHRWPQARGGDWCGEFAPGQGEDIDAAAAAPPAAAIKPFPPKPRAVR